MRASRVVRGTPDVAYAGANGGSQGRDDPICRDGWPERRDPQQSRAAPPSAMSNRPRRSEGDDTDFPHAEPARSEATLVPEGECGVGLKEEPSPSDLDGHGADGGATGLGDALVEGVITTLIGSGRESGEAGDLATVLDLTPREELEGEEPGRLEADALEGHELADELERGIMGRGLEALVLELLDETDALRDIATVEPLTFETLAELGVERGAVEEAQVVELVEECAIEGRDREALGSEETLDAVGDASSVVT